MDVSFQSGKNVAGFDQHRVRHWLGSWHRWTLPAMLAHAFLAVLAPAQQDPPT